MGLVTQELLKRIATQVDRAGTVVWYDPRQDYAELAAALAPADLGCEHVHRYSAVAGFLVLRHDLEPLWGQGDQPPRLVLYVPLPRQETAAALIEYEVAGVVMQPGQQPPAQDTALAAVAQAALSHVLPPAAVTVVVEQVQAGQLSLPDLDRVAEKGAEAQTGALAMVFDSGNAHEIGLRFLVDDALDAEIEKRQATAALRQLLSDTLGVALAGDAPQDLRRLLARQVLMTDYLVALGGRMPEAYAAFPLPGQETARQGAARLAADWRNRRDGAESYVHWAARVADEMAIASVELPLEALRQVETFLPSEQRMLALVEDALLQRVSQRLRELIARRIRSFWASKQPNVKKHWEVVASAADVLAEATRIEAALKGKTWRADALLSNYAHGEAPWCLLDSAQRHLERDFHQFDPDPVRHDGLLKLVAHARLQYSQVADDLAVRFIAAYAAEHFEVAGVLAQADIYAETVASTPERTAYLLVDALRYEMARELVDLIDSRWRPHLHVALATPPTITDVGMAALMPGAEHGLALEAAAGGKLDVIVDGVKLKGRGDRVAHFLTKAGGHPAGSAAETTIDQLAPLSNPSLRKRLSEVHLILVTASDEIDGLWEQNPSLARRMMDDALNQLRRAIHTLFGLGVRRIVVTADHGYLFGERLSSGQAMDAPGGQTALLKRRVWLGKGGSTQPGVLRRPLSAFGIGGDLELVTPTSLACFKVQGGSMEYFHGGLSLPEIVIPVLVLTSPEQPQAADAGEPNWQIALGSRTLSTRFVSVTVTGDSGGLLPVASRAVRVEVRAAGAVISTPVSASYGFDDASKDAQMEPRGDAPQSFMPNTITLMITDEPAVKTVSVQLLDANTGRRLAAIDAVEQAISI